MPFVKTATARQKSTKDLKQKIKEQFNIVPKAQRLLYSGKILNDNNDLMACNILKEKRKWGNMKKEKEKEKKKKKK